MPKSTSTPVFPDLNVWLALNYQTHPHFQPAQTWYAALSTDTRMVFCRLSQMGLLRLLTNPAVMKEDVLNATQAWRIYDQWLADAVFLDEPAGLGEKFREYSRNTVKTPGDWADAYLAAFAEIADIRLVTFDRRLHSLSDNSILLKL